MAIEIRELVIKASVHKSLGSDDKDVVTKNDLYRLQEKLTSQLLRKMKSMIEESRSSR
jgi:hypothetical protein